MTYTITTTRLARATLQVTQEIEADSIEEAVRVAERQADYDLTADQFTVTNMDLGAYQGTAEVVEVGAS